MPLALPPVEGENLQAGVVVQLLHPAFEKVGGHNLAYTVEPLREEWRTENAELLGEHGKPPAIDDDGDIAAGARLLKHVLVLAKLRAREEPNLELAVRSRLDLLLEYLETLVERVVGGQRRVDVQRIVGGKANSRQRQRGNCCEKSKS